MGIKIAVLGSAPSSNRLAPFSDKSWVIWACSPANMQFKMPRIDVWFEMHAWSFEEKAKSNPAYRAWIKRHPIIYMQGHDPEYPQSQRYPIELIRQFDPWGAKYFLTSSPALMLAMACVAVQNHIEKTGETDNAIGMWGVDMAAQGEYGYQRPGCQYWMKHVLEVTGIDLVTPTESDINQPPPLYGYCESTYMWRRYNSRMTELNARMQALHKQETEARNTRLVLQGAMESAVYDMRTWIPHEVDDDRHVEPQQAPPIDPKAEVEAIEKAARKAARKEKRQASEMAQLRRKRNSALIVGKKRKPNGKIGADDTNQAEIEIEGPARGEAEPSI